MDERLSMMHASISKAANKAQAKTRKVCDGLDAPTGRGAPQGRQQAVADIRAMLDADTTLRVCKDGVAERAIRAKERVRQNNKKNFSRSFHGVVGNRAGLDPEECRAPSLFDSEPHEPCRKSQSFDVEVVMHRKPRKACSFDRAGASTKKYPSSSFDVVQAERSRPEEKINSLDSLLGDGARPLSPTTEFLLSGALDVFLSLNDDGMSKSNTRECSSKDSDGAQYPRNTKDSSFHVEIQRS